MTLTPLSRSRADTDCLHPISWMNEWILTKLVNLYCCNMEKSWLDFGDLDPIFKVTGGLRLLENGLNAPYLLKEQMDFDQTCTAILLWLEKELIRFWWPRSHLQGHRRAQIVWKWLVCTPFSRMNGWLLTKLAQLYCWDRDKIWLDFGDLDPIFKVTRGLKFWKMVPIDDTYTHKKKRNYRYNVFQQYVCSNWWGTYVFIWKHCSSFCVCFSIYGGNII